MRNFFHKKALARLLLSLPILGALFGSAALPSLVAWSRLYAPNWAPIFSAWERNTGPVECFSALLLMCVHAPMFLRGFDGLRKRRPGADTLLSLAVLSSFLIGLLPRVLDWTAGLFILSPLYASTMSALLSFGAVGEEIPSYFHLVGLWAFFLAVGDFLRARAAVLLARASGSGMAMPEGEISASLTRIPIFAAALALLLSVLCGIVWLLLGVSLPFAVAFALFLLLSAAPCALPLAEAVPLWIGAALMEERGASLRSLRAVEAVVSADTLVLGKPGILDKGAPQITDIVPEGLPLTALMALAAAAESGSRHPIAKAIAEHAIRLRAKYGRIAAFSESPGEGVEALMNGAPIRVGKKAWIASQGVRISANLLTKDDQLAEKGKTVLYVSNGKNAKGIIAYEYRLDETAPETIRALEKQNVFTILMVGEGARTAKALAKRLGVPSCRHNVKAASLMREIQLLQAQGKNVALFADLAEDSAPMKQADCPILPLPDAHDGKPSSPRRDVPSSRRASDGALTMEADEIGGADAAPPLPALAVRRFSALPAARALLQSLRAVVRQNTLIAFLGPLCILPAASGILVTMGYPFPAPWLVVMATLPGLAAAVVNAVRMGRRLAAVPHETDDPKKEELSHEP